MIMWNVLRRRRRKLVLEVGGNDCNVRRGRRRNNDRKLHDWIRMTNFLHDLVRVRVARGL